MNKEELKELRHKLGLSQPAMAEKLGVTRDAIAKYEAGDCNISRPVAMLAEQLVKTQ
jgi:DNA-binding XRE family transcriptional regulator